MFLSPPSLGVSPFSPPASSLAWHHLFPSTVRCDRDLLVILIMSLDHGYFSGGFISLKHYFYKHLHLSHLPEYDGYELM